MTEEEKKNKKKKTSKRKNAPGYLRDQVKKMTDRLAGHFGKESLIEVNLADIKREEDN